MTTLISEEDIRKEMEKLGACKEGIDIMLPKSKFRVIKMENIPSSVANVLKQEMLAAGGDVAVAIGTVSCKVEKTDVLLMGTLDQYQKVLPKLKYNVRDCPKVAELIKKVLE